MRRSLITLALLTGLAAPATAQFSVSIGLPQLSIGINLPLLPQLVLVPGYPVYYAPGLDSNYFFYDGLYWVYEGDDWYASDWYNGPWAQVDRARVPLFVLRVPVRYYRSPPSYFRGWASNAPPRWGEHWGNDWQQRRRGWDRWDRAKAPAPAPLPAYQKRFPESRYPQVEQQRDLRQQNYRHQPRDPVLAQPRVPPQRPPRADPLAPEHHTEQPVQPPPQRAVPRPPPQSQPRELPRQQPREGPRAQPPGRGPESGDKGRGKDRDKDRDDGDDRKKPPGR